jgi:hypothetical protein
MSRRLLKALGGVTSVAMATALLHAAPAQAREADERTTTIAVTARATGPNHFNSSATVELPAGGTATVTSPSINKSMTKATVEVTNESDDPLFDQLAFHLAQLPTPGKRIIACLTAALEAVDLGADTEAISEVSADAGQISIVVLFFCLLVAKAVADQKAAQQRVVAAAAPGCAISPLQIKTTTEKTDDGYTMSATSHITAKKKKSKIKVKCKRVGNKNVYTVTPRKKGQTLKKAVGSHLTVGIASPNNATASLPLRVGFKAP